MTRTGTMRTVLAVVVLACGMAGSIEWTAGTAPAEGLLSGDVRLCVSSAAAGEARTTVRRASCTLVRYYVAKYTAPVAEAWARSKGASDAEIEVARTCIKPQLTAQLGRMAE